MKYNGIELGVNFVGREFENPFILAAAPPSDELGMVESAFEHGWAGAVLKTTSVEGTPVPLVYPMMSYNSYSNEKLIGMGNIDLISQYHIDELEKRVKYLKKKYPKKIVIVSIMGSKKEEWQLLVKRLEDAGVDIIECSFSCPQGSMGEAPGAMLSQSIDATEKVTSWVKEAATNVPVVIKITPQVTDIVAVARAVKNGGADAICASNTVPSLMGIDVDDFVPYPKVHDKSTFSGYSGPAIKPITLRTISLIAKEVGLPITGTGGPTTWEDAVQFMAVGAYTVQFATAVMHYGFDIIDDLTDGLSFYMEEKGFQSVSDIIGKSLDKIVEHEQLPRKGKPVAFFSNKDFCVKCRECFVACRDGGHEAIEIEPDTGYPLINEDKCLGCRLCVSVCPTNALSIKWL